MSAAGVCAELVAPVANMLAAAVAAGRLVSTTAGIPTRVASGAGDASVAGGTSAAGARRSRVRGQTKVRATHLDRTAVIYVRQSTLAQVREHTESTMRQYALAEEATRLGWAADAVEVIDADLGVSGRSVEGRDGFKALVARVCLGEVGAVFGLEISRLARSSADLSRLLELARLHRHPGHRRRRDLRPGRLQRPSAARVEGDDERGRAAPAGRSAAGRETRRRRAGRAAHPAAGRLRLRRGQRGRDRPGRGGRRRGRRRVHRVHRDRVGLRGGRGVHRSPVPPPRLWRSVGRAGPVRPADPLPGVLDPVQPGLRRRLRLRPVPLPPHRASGRVGAHGHPRAAPDQWAVCIHDHHDGYIDWDTFLANESRLAANRTNAGARPPREGTALCQGIVFCGCCGRSMSSPLRRSAPVLRVRPLPRRPRRHPRLPLGARRHRG